MQPKRNWKVEGPGPRDVLGSQHIEPYQKREITYNLFPVQAVASRGRLASDNL
jgi:hypothetical protein